jgi:hypothetical protein
MGRFKFIFGLNLSLEKTILSRGDLKMTCQLCNQMLKILKTKTQTFTKTTTKAHLLLSCFGGCGSGTPKGGSAAL